MSKRLKRAIHSLPMPYTYNYKWIFQDEDEEVKWKLCNALLFFVLLYFFHALPDKIYFIFANVTSFVHLEYLTYEFIYLFYLFSAHTNFYRYDSGVRCCCGIVIYITLIIFSNAHYFITY